jgi:hypothetical protein
MRLRAVGSCGSDGGCHPEPSPFTAEFPASR